MQFGRLPNWWFRKDDGLMFHLRADDTGTGIAAMKCLLGIAVLVDFHSLSVDSSLNDMELITGLSRPMVIRGIEKLSELGFIAVDRTNYKNRYILCESPNDRNWAKVPVAAIRKNLKMISNQGIAPFAALKIYITLLSLRYQDKNTVMINHETLRGYTRLQANQIRKGLDVLYCCPLIHLMAKEDIGSNRYKLIGL